MIPSLTATVQTVYRRIFASPAFRATAGRRRFAGFHSRVIHRQAILLPALLLASLGSALVAQTPEIEAANQKPEKGFYTAKDRLNAMHSAALFLPGKVSEADITAGPPQQKHLFQIHDLFIRLKQTQIPNSPLESLMWLLNLFKRFHAPAYFRGVLVINYS